MSERLSFTAGDKEYDMTPENAFLVRYRKVGEAGIRAAMYDHVLLTEEQTEENEAEQVFAWLDIHGEEYADEVQKIMLDEGFTAMLNMPDPDEKIVKAFDDTVIASQVKDIEDGLPEDWS